MGFSKALVRLEGWAPQFLPWCRARIPGQAMLLRAWTIPPLAALPVNVPGICPDYVRKSVKTQSLLIPKPL